MKRFTTLAGLAFASLIGAFAFTAPAHAAPIDCTTVTQASGPQHYPQNYLWVCTGVTASDSNAARDSLAKLGNVAIGAVSDAKTQLSTPSHYVYVFSNQADFHTYCAQVGNLHPTPACASGIPADATGITYTLDGGTTYQSLVFEDKASVAPNTSVGNTAAHEAGHQLDRIYGVSLYGTGYASQETREFAFKLTGASALVQGGPITVGDTLTITFEGTLLSSTPVTYTVAAGDTTTSLIATHFASKINGTAALTTSTIDVNATTNGARINITSDAILKYSVSATGNRESLALSDYDWPTFLARTPQCALSGGVFSEELAANGNPICSGLQPSTVGGTVHATDVITLKVTDTTLTGGFENVPYTVLAGANTTTIATGIAAAITADSNLSTHNIKAVSSGSAVSISSGTNLSTYGVTYSMGSTTTLTLGSQTIGGGNTLANGFSGTNDAVLQAAWPADFTTVNLGTPTALGGTITATDVLTVVVSDAILPGGMETVHYTVVAGTTASNALAFAAKIAADPVLSAHNISAYALDSHVYITSATGSTYAFSTNVGATETLTQGVLTNGWNELFADETAFLAGPTVGGNQTQDDYLGSGNFVCSKNFVNAVEKTGAAPTATSFAYSPACK